MHVDVGDRHELKLSGEGLTRGTCGTIPEFQASVEWGVIALPTARRGSRTRVGSWGPQERSPACDPVPAIGIPSRPLTNDRGRTASRVSSRHGLSSLARSYNREIIRPEDAKDVVVRRSLHVELGHIALRIVECPQNEPMSAVRRQRPSFRPYGPNDDDVIIESGLHPIRMARRRAEGTAGASGPAIGAAQLAGSCPCSGASLQTCCDIRSCRTARRFRARNIASRPDPRHQPPPTPHQAATTPCGLLLAALCGPIR